MFYAGAFAVTNILGVKVDKVAGRKEPMWKRRLQNKIIRRIQSGYKTCEVKLMLKERRRLILPQEV